MSTSPLPKLFTMEEVAERFRVSRRTLQAHLRQHPYYRTLGRRKLFTEPEIARLYEALPCPSVSSHPEKARPRTGASVARISKSLLTEAQELIGRPLQIASDNRSSAPSNAATIPRQDRRRMPQHS